MGRLKNIVWIAILLILLQSACSDQEPAQIPAGVLSQEQMQKVTADVLIGESYTQMHRLSIDSGKRATARFYTEIFSKYHTSKEQYYKSLTYYLQHPDLMEENLQTVTDSLSSLEARLH